ncbi:MAG: response regulator [Rhodobacteraceae bacterium]|nr:response regulator [Paracoccaceae bacterium]
MILVYMIAGATVGLLATIIAALLRGNSMLSSLKLQVVDRVKHLFGRGDTPKPLAINDSKSLAVTTVQEVLPEIVLDHGPLRILAVDDDPFILGLIPIIAGNAGFADITVASSAEAALDLIITRKAPFDCLVLDIRMPGMDGIDLCAHVREIPAYKDVPIIMLTAMRDMDHLERAFKAGATDFATKPFEVAEFEARLSALSQQCQARRTEHLTDVNETSKLQDDQIKPELFDDLALGVVTNLISHRSIRNYLQQLSAFSATDARVRAVKLDQFSLISEKTTAKKCFSVLSEVADIIGEVFASSKFAMAYSGNGVFVLVSNQNSELAAHDLEEESQAILNSRLSELGVELDTRFSVSVGASVQPQVLVSNRADKAIFYAICNAEARLASKEHSYATRA